MREASYDVVVIGAGPVGQTVAERSRSEGLTVVVVERELVGGECSYWACVPSKALLRPVLAVADARRVDGAREAVSGSVNTDGVFAVSTPENKTVVITARHAVAICGAASPDLPGVSEIRPWTNRRATDSSSVPNRLAIIGGGGVAVEMATARQGLGPSVTLLARGSGLLPAWSPS
jgi:pyruvate/2-oxoglutarate dehydrogenase complex dihydrolipoamide dehydrogenase (E3) component